MGEEIDEEEAKVANEKKHKGRKRMLEEERDTDAEYKIKETIS